MSDEDLKAIEQRLKEVCDIKLEFYTEELYDDDSHWWHAEVRVKDSDSTVAIVMDDYWSAGELFSHAPADIAALVAEVKRLREERQELVKYLKEERINKIHYGDGLFIGSGTIEQVLDYLNESYE